MSQAQAENVIRDIICELVQRCASRGEEVSETLAAFMIKAVVLDPRNGFDVDRTLTPQDVHKLTEICLQRLTERCSPFLDTVKMQVYFDLSYTTRREFVAEIHHVVDSKLSPLSREITDSRVKTRDQIQNLYQKSAITCCCAPAWAHQTTPTAFTKPLADVRASVQRVERLQSELTAQLHLLRDTVKSKRAVPAAQVYPLFRSVSRLWSGLQDEAELLHIFSNLALSLRPFVSSQAQIFSEESMDELLQGSQIKSDADRKRVLEDRPINPEEVSGPDTEWLSPERSGDSETQSVQYSGFCGHALVCQDGLLLPGNPQLGLLKYKDKLYTFSSREAALQFASAPEHYISEVAERAKRSPELIQLLCLHRQFSCVTPYSELQSGEHLLVRPITRSSSGTQTDTHPVESYIDKAYEWNEWALRRKALKLVDLRSKLTHSTQTNLSHMRRHNCTQTYPPKDAAGQTTLDGESGVPEPVVYLAGLQGQRGRPMVKVELTRPLDE
ncbi:hypothetical protein WMY93_016136 [Mugilogobius chulae]|uniref:Cilia- and flagella-associated protein 206 n=1 Tax=Mugilogobius chulae TaxID=88201 RepID=A0AAW0NWR5_9GOBI